VPEAQSDILCTITNTLNVVPPSFRSDLSREIDLIEEVARVVGYARIPATLPSVGLAGASLPDRRRWTREVKRVLAAMGLTEAIPLSFTSARMNELFPGLGTNGNPVVLLNPLSREESELRLSLLAGLLSMWRVNRNQGAASIAAFSVGKVYWWEEGAGEGWRLAGLLAGALPSTGLGQAQSAGFNTSIEGNNKPLRSGSQHDVAFGNVAVAAVDYIDLQFVSAKLVQRVLYRLDAALDISFDD